MKYIWFCFSKYQALEGQVLITKKKQVHMTWFKRWFLLQVENGIDLEPSATD